MTDLSRRLLLGAALASLSGCAPLVMRPESNGAISGGPRFESDTFISFDGARLPLSSWTPSGPVRRVIVALHGMNDYAMAFQDDGPVFAAQGVATYAYDQRGFGRGPHRGLWAGRDLLAADLKAAVQAARRAHPGVPVTVLGHSMGGAVAISAFADKDPPEADGLVLAAPAIWGWNAQPPLNRVALWLSAHVTPGAHLSPPAWVARKYQSSDNIPVLIRMGRDPNLLFTTRIDAVYGLVGLMQAATDRIGAVRAPVLYLYGANDRFVPREPTMATVERLKPSDRSSYYPDGWHLLLRDLHGDRVRGDILAWLDNHAAALPSGSRSIPEGLRPPAR